MKELYIIETLKVRDYLFQQSLYIAGKNTLTMWRSYLKKSTITMIQAFLLLLYIISNIQNIDTYFL